MTEFYDNSSETQLGVEPCSLNMLVGSIEDIAAAGVVDGTEAVTAQEKLHDFRESGLSTYGESLLTEDQLLNKRLLAIGKDAMELGATYPVDHLIPITRKFISRTGGMVLGPVPGSTHSFGRSHFRQNGRIRKLAQQLQAVSAMIPEPSEDITDLSIPDLSKHPTEVSQGQVTERDIELYFGRQFADLLTYFKHPQVQTALAQLRVEWPTNDDMITISFQDMDEPWEQAFTALGTICNPESSDAHRVTCILLEAIDSWVRDPSDTVMSKVSAENADSGKFVINELTHLKLAGFKFLDYIYKNGAVRAAEHEEELVATLLSRREAYEQKVREALLQKKAFTVSLLATQNDTQEELLERLTLEARVDKAIGTVLDAKPPGAKISPIDKLERSDISAARRSVLHEYIAKLAASEQETVKNNSVAEILAELDNMRSKYSLSRANFREYADPNLEHTRNLTNGFTGILTGRQLTEPVSKTFARDFLSTMYKIADDLKQRDAREVFDELLLDLEREDYLTASLGDFGGGTMLADRGTSLRERLTWYVANELQLSGTMLKVLPDYVPTVLNAFEEYWNALSPDAEVCDAEKGAVSSVDYDRAQEILGSLIELNFRLFPPDTGFEALKEELINHVGNGTKRAERIQWQKLENLVLLYDYYGEIEGVGVNLYRALPGSLKQSFPYYVLELNIEQPDGAAQRIAIGENPLRDNATYVIKEDDDQGWQTVFGLTKPEARDKGASRIWHSRDSVLRAQHFTKIIDYVAQLDAALLAFELSSGTH